MTERLARRTWPAALTASLAPASLLLALHALLAASAPVASAHADAQWERRWLSPLDPNLCSTTPATSSRFVDAMADGAFHLEGGDVDLTLEQDASRVSAAWTLRQVRAPWGWLHATLPPGFMLHAAQANQTELTPHIDGNHLALPLDACAGRPCDVQLEFSVILPRRDSAQGVWLRADAILPRLGLDGDRLLRAPALRSEHGLPAFLTLPSHAAAPAMEGVAPAGRWQWQLRQTNGGPMPGTERGSTAGALDFQLAMLPGPFADVIQTLEIHHPGLAASALETLAKETAALARCVQTRMSGVPDIARLVITPDAAVPLDGPDGQPAAHLAGGTIWLPQRLLTPGAARRASLARAMARRHVADAARARLTRGAQWLTEGLPGAVALLCAAEQAPPDAMRQLLQQASERATQAMTAQSPDIGAVAYAAFGGWVRHYAPLAALAPVRRLTATQIRTLLSDIASGVQLQYALSRALGGAGAALVLSMPLATDLSLAPDGSLTGQHWRWQQGGWRPVGTPSRAWTLPAAPAPDSVQRSGADTPGPAAAHAGAAGLRLDHWSGYERNFLDNPIEPPSAPAQRPGDPPP